MRKFLILFSALVFFACKEQNTNKETGSEVKATTETNEVAIIDVHTHFHKDRNYFNDFMNDRKMKTILVDVAKHNATDSTKVERSWDDYVALAEKHPDLFWLCSSLMGLGIDAPDFAQKEIERLKKEIAQGAKMGAIWIKWSPGLYGLCNMCHNRYIFFL